MTNMNVIPVSQDSYIVNGCKVKITYAEDGDSMKEREATQTKKKAKKVAPKKGW